MSKLTGKEMAYCQNIAEYGEDKKVKAYIDAGYSTSMSDAAIAVQADKLFNKPKLNLKIRELQKVTEKIAEKKFSISVEKRLRWLNDIVEAGMGTYKDSNEQDRRENLAAAKGAIETMNSMLGTGEDGKKAIPINVTIGVRDCS